MQRYFKGYSESAKPQAGGAPDRHHHGLPEAKEAGELARRHIEEGVRIVLDRKEKAALLSTSRSLHQRLSAHFGELAVTLGGL